VPISLPEFPFDAKTAVSIVVGAFLLPHTIAKLGNIERSSQLFEKIGFRPPRFFVVFTSLMELVAAVGLITRLYPRIASLIAATILIVAAYAIARLHGLKWRWQHPGVEYMLLWAIVCLCVGFLP
jgi:putative oxidoreductase